MAATHLQFWTRWRRVGAALLDSAAPFAAIVILWRTPRCRPGTGPCPARKARRV